MNQKEQWDKQTLTVQNIATIFKLGKNSAYNLVDKKEFHSIKVGTSIRVSMKIFKSWIDSQNFQLDEYMTFENQVYTIYDIMQMLDISKNSAYSLIEENHFDVIRIGKIIRISKKSFDLWLNQS